uniref:Uncharacterized protein n=1 Tax=Chryseobacterium endophyticum TaxID=1854762 RepID=A0AAU6WMW1_9FLAO
MPRLLPLQINALYLDQPQQIIGQDIRFENIPWMNMPEDVFENPNTPFDTSSVIPRPFSYDNAVYLEKGVHIHFVLPGFFKKFDDQEICRPLPTVGISGGETGNGSSKAITSGMSTIRLWTGIRPAATFGESRRETFRSATSAGNISVVNGRVRPAGLRSISGI